MLTLSVTPQLPDNPNTFITYVDQCLYGKKYILDAKLATAIDAVST